MSAIKGNVALRRKRTGKDGLGKGSSVSAENGVMAVGVDKLKELNQMLEMTVEMALERPQVNGARHDGLQRAHTESDAIMVWGTATRFANGVSITAAAAEAAAAAAMEDTGGDGEQLSAAVRKYATIDRERLMDILDDHSDQDAEWARLQAALNKRASILRSTYVSSSAEGQGSEMDVKEFWRLIKQCKIVDKKFDNHVIDAIFVQVNKESGDSKANESNPDQELVPSEFVEGIVRIAYAKFNPKDVQTLTAGPKMTVSVALKKLIDEYIQGKVVQLLTGNYRQKLRDPMLKVALKEVNSTLQKIFKKYSTSSTDGGVGGKTLNIKEWVLFNKEFKLNDPRYDHRATQAAFIKSQVSALHPFILHK
jgi:hypothetical protein